MIKIGMLIGDRYEIVEKIGTGGMSDVYKAKCHKLNRFVAIKVLKQEFSENTNFVSKFRIEAQAAAGLMHPNIVNVYDVGEENGIHYIVMELVEGITLKKYIEKKARLSVKETISIAIQVSMGIEAAHNNHIIHRDIKPQNIIISKEGKVKVTDFGIAKAATSNTITSNVMGSVHYTSPEQARGGYSDEKSDIYSLGITLFEMLTGRVPFNGETTVAIAIKQIQEEMPSPRDFVPEIPISVEQIVFKCTQKSPDRRYQTVPELIEDLKKSLINPDENFVRVMGYSEHEETVAILDRDLSKIKRQIELRETVAPVMKQQPVQNKPKSSKNAPSKKQVKFQKKEEIEDVYNPKLERMLVILTVTVSIIIILMLLFIGARALGLFSGDQTQTMSVEQGVMPEVVNKEQAEAEALLTAAGILYEVEYDKSSEYKAGIVMSASVEAGETVSESDTVVITVSAEQNGVEIPDVTGKLKAEAIANLENAGFVVVKEEASSSDVAAGNVISQSPKAGNLVSFGTQVTIVVSIGKTVTNATVPNVLGMTEVEAKQAIEAAGFVVSSVTEVDNTEYTLGRVCYQSYSEGAEIEAGTGIELRLSLGGKYTCNTVVNAPADYQGGDAEIVVTGDENGAIIYSATVTTFPQTINVSGIEDTASGVVTITYIVSVEEKVTDANGVETTQVSQQTKTENIPVTFTREP